jgi:adenylate kinase
MGRVIYFTGVPSAGKTTLCEHLVKLVPETNHFRFGRELTTELNAVSTVTQEGLRSGTAHVSTPDIVSKIDERAISRANELRASKNFILDTHALTSEAYGFRLTAMSLDQIRRLAPDFIVCVTAFPSTILSRLKSAPMGRPMLNEDQLRQQAHLQQSLVVTYSTACNVPAYFLENNNEPQLAANLSELEALLTPH